MWFLKKKSKIFLEDFSLEIFNEIFNYESDNKVINRFHESVSIPNFTDSVPIEQIHAIYLEVYSLTISLNYPLLLSLRLEDSLRDYIYNVQQDNYLYDYILGDYNLALSNKISESCSKEDIIELTNQRFLLFKKCISTPKILGGNYNEIIVARVLNRLGANQNNKQTLWKALGQQLFENQDYKSDTNDSTSLFNLLMNYQSDLEKRMKGIKLY